MNERLFIDRIEGELAILLDVSGRRIEIQVRHLPKDLREGDWLEANLSRDPGLTEAMRNAVRRVRETLTVDDDGEDFTL